MKGNGKDNERRATIIPAAFVKGYNLLKKYFENRVKTVYTKTSIYNLYFIQKLDTLR